MDVIFEIIIENWFRRYFSQFHDIIKKFFSNFYSKSCAVSSPSIPMTQTLLGLYPDSTRTLIFNFFMENLLGLYSDSIRTLPGLYPDSTRTF